MAATIFDGPLYSSGDMNSVPSAGFGSYVGDPNGDSGPDAVFQGQGILDVRWWFQKDQIVGFKGRAPQHMAMPFLKSINQIPAALGANNIAAAQAPATGPLTLAARSLGVERNMPIIPYGIGGIANGTVTTAAIALDFGFAFGTVTSGSTNVTVASSADFQVGMPLVIAGVGNSGGTVPLLTNVASITSTTVIVIADKPSASLNPAPIGTGNIWGPNPLQSTNPFPTPLAALPWIKGGPGLYLDPRQSIARNVRCVGLATSTGGTITVAGWDIYGTPMTETITLAAGANTVYGQKAFKYIGSVTANYTDTINVTVGTGDTFGFHHRATNWEDTRVCWAAALMTSSTGYTAPLSLNTTATATTADVRGTIQTGAAGAGTGIGSTASNGTVSSLAMSGNRLMMEMSPEVWPALTSNAAGWTELYGAQQF